MITQTFSFDPKNYYIKEGYRNQSTNFNDPKNREHDYWSKSRQSINLLFQQDTYRYAVEIIKRYNINSVADVGCGVGEKMQKFIAPLGVDVVGIDLPESVAIAKKRFGDMFVADNFENEVPAVSKKYDLVICSDVIEHMVNPDHLLNYIKRITHSDSYSIFSTPERDYHRGFDCTTSEKPEHIREWNTLELKTYLENRGFIIKEHFMIDFIRGSIFVPRSLKLRHMVKKQRGTTKTTQVLLCLRDNEVTV